MEYKRLTFRHKSVVDGTEQIGYTEIIAGCYRASDMILDRLATLEDKIENGTLKEERTCKNVSEMNSVDGFTCSECGISLVDFVEERVDEEYHASWHEYEFKYCPNCGAKVVEYEH